MRNGWSLAGFDLRYDIQLLLGAFVLSGALVVIAVVVCQRKGWVARPRFDRWHRGSPTLFGGVPIWLACVVLSAFVFPLPERHSMVWRLLAVSSAVFLLGLADDVARLRPQSKLAGQALAAFAIAGCGFVYPLTQNSTVNFWVSVVWIVGITNAFNLLDNMDGLSAGVALIAGAYLAAFYAGNGSVGYHRLALIVAAAAAGFLAFNFHPAKVFMGDCGSLFLGFLLAALSLPEATHVSGLPVLVLAPAVVLAVPIFDTAFVSFTRRLRGQAVSQGGVDHSSHRLVRLGLGERDAVLLLLGLSMASGAVALAARHMEHAHALGLIGVWFFLLLLFGVYLFREETTSPDPRWHVGRPRWANGLARDGLAWLLDPLALSLAYYLAYFLRFRAAVPEGDMALFFRTWPLVVAAQFGCLAGCRTYRHSWWRSSFGDCYRLAKAVMVGEAAVVLLLTARFRFAGFSRAVFALDALFSLALLVGIRLSFLFLNQSFALLRSASARSSLLIERVAFEQSFFGGNLFRKPASRRYLFGKFWSRHFFWRALGAREGDERSGPGRPSGGRRVIVLGTTERAELALNYLRGQRIDCAGLIDTNGGSDLARWVWGVPVIGDLEHLWRLAAERGVSEIVWPMDEVLAFSGAELRERCERSGLRLLRVGLYAPGDVNDDEVNREEYASGNVVGAHLETNIAATIDGENQAEVSSNAIRGGF